MMRVGGLKAPNRFYLYSLEGGDVSATGENFVVILVDESAAMSAVMRDRTADGTDSVQTNAQRVATSVNNLLRQLAEGPKCDVALVGYRSDATGQPDVGVRWPATLSGLEFVSSRELCGAAKMEQRVRKAVQADGAVRDESVAFHVWYEPSLGVKAPQIAAFTFCRDLVNRRVTERGGRGIVVHVFSGASSDGTPQRVVDEILGDSNGTTLVQCHVAASSALVTTAFPSRQAFVASGMARDLFSRASELPEAAHDAFRSLNVPVQVNARAVVHNAKMSDVYRCLQLARLHVAGNTGAAASIGSTAVPLTNAAPHHAAENGAESGSVPGPALVLLILDRSVEAPYSGAMPNACSRLSEAGNELLKLLASGALQGLPVDAAIISYGQGGDGTVELREGFEGPLAGRSVVRNTELLAGAIRVEEVETQVSNGAGGLVTVTKKTPIFFDVEPSAAASPLPAFVAAAGVTRDWLATNSSGTRPLILHLTRGEHAVPDVEVVAAELEAIDDCRRPSLQHLILTDRPHRSLAYPHNDQECETDSLKALWRASSIVPHWEAVQAARRPYVTEDSRALVINGRFDILGEQLHAMLGAPRDSA